MTDHCFNSERLEAVLSGELAIDELNSAESHLGECESCRKAMEQILQLDDWYGQVCESLRNGSASTTNRPDTGALSEVSAVLAPSENPQMLGRIASYEVVGILGRGGMGVVLKGFDAALNRFVAIKMLRPHLATSGAARQRFAREAKAAAAVTDDHVMAIHNVSEWQGLPFFVMPYSSGISLQKRLTDEGPLEVTAILRIAMQTAKGLAAAHAQGLVHRDVKPANILLDDGVERVTLTDFGLARAVDDASLTHPGTLAGTPQYMSPEQASGKSVDSRSDLFSLGSVIYAMCTGRPPFRAESSHVILRQVIDNDPGAIVDFNPHIPTWLVALVDKLMAKNPADRIGTAAEAAEILESCLAHVQQPTKYPLPEWLTKQTVTAWRISSTPVFLLIGGVFMITIVIGLLCTFWNSDPGVNGMPTGIPVPSGKVNSTNTKEEKRRQSYIRLSDPKNAAKFTKARVIKLLGPPAEITQQGRKAEIVTWKDSFGVAPKKTQYRLSLAFDTAGKVVASGLTINRKTITKTKETTKMKVGPKRPKRFPTGYYVSRTEEAVLGEIQRANLQLIYQETTRNPKGPVFIRGAHGTAKIFKHVPAFPFFVDLPYGTREMEWTSGKIKGRVGNAKLKRFFTHVRCDWTADGLVWRCYGPRGQAAALKLVPEDPFR